VDLKNYKIQSAFVLRRFLLSYQKKFVVQNGLKKVHASQQFHIISTQEMHTLQALIELPIFCLGEG